MDLLRAKANADADQLVAFWKDHLHQLVSAYRANMGKYDRNTLLMNSIKALMEGDNDREALCSQVMVAVDMMARSQDI